MGGRHAGWHEPLDLPTTLEGQARGGPIGSSVDQPCGLVALGLEIARGIRRKSTQWSPAVSDDLPALGELFDSFLELTQWDRNRPREVSGLVFLLWSDVEHDEIFLSSYPLP